MATNDFPIVVGANFQRVIRWETTPVVYIPISNITQVAGPVVTTSVVHGVPPGWPVAVSGVVGMTQINALRTPPKGDDWHKAYVQNTTMIQLNDVDASAYQPYVSGGFLQYNTPALAAGMTAVLNIMSAYGSTPIFTTSSVSGDIVLDAVTNFTITINITAAQTALLVPQNAVYQLLLTSSGGVVTEVLAANAPITYS